MLSPLNTHFVLCWKLLLIQGLMLTRLSFLSVFPEGQTLGKRVFASACKP